MFFHKRRAITPMKFSMNNRTIDVVHKFNDNDNDNDNECFILTYELIKQIIYSTMIDQYSHSQGNYIMTYISLACFKDMCCNQFVMFF